MISSTKSIKHYSRDFYLNSDCKSLDEQLLTVKARENIGVAWNRIIGGVIVDQLHEKILDVPSTNLLSLVNILVLVQAGWLYTASQLVIAQSALLKQNDIEQDVLDWFISACQEGDNT